MTDYTALLPMLLHEALAAFLFWGGFCRATLMTRGSTRLDVRLSFFALTLASLVALFAPVLWRWQPDPVSISLLLGICAVQGVTSRHWARGLPAALAQPHHGAANALPPGGMDRLDAALARMGEATYWEQRMQARDAQEADLSPEPRAVPAASKPAAAADFAVMHASQPDLRRMLHGAPTEPRT